MASPEERRDLERMKEARALKNAMVEELEAKASKVKEGKEFLHSVPRLFKWVNWEIKGREQSTAHPPRSYRNGPAVFTTYMIVRARATAEDPADCPAPRGVFDGRLQRPVPSASD